MYSSAASILQEDHFLNSEVISADMRCKLTLHRSMRDQSRGAKR